MALRDIVVECKPFDSFSSLTGWSIDPVQRFTQVVRPISKRVSSLFALFPLFLFAL